MGLHPSASNTSLLLECQRPFADDVEVVCIYKVTCRMNGKCYVGQTRQKLRARWMAHISYARRGYDNMALARAIRRHGVDAFDVEQIDAVPLEKANTVERAWISRLNCRVPHGYNLESGGGVAKTAHTSTCAKISAANSKRMAAMSRKQRRALAMRMHDGMTPEARSERSRKNAAMITPERNAARAIKLKTVLTKKQRARASRKGWAKLSTKQRADRADKIRNSIGHDRRHDMALKAWKTRRADSGGPRCSPEMVRQARAMLNEGVSLNGIARTLDVPRMTITRALRAETVGV